MLPAKKFEELPSSSFLNSNFSAVLGAITNCKQCSGITVESGTFVKTVKITSKIFAVFALVETVNETSAPTIVKS